MIPVQGVLKDYNNITIIVNDLLCIRKEFVQIKFPKSKKKRIRNKWKKRSINFGVKDVHYIFSVNNQIFVSSKIYERLQKKIPYGI